jgi:hypothetical protein
VTPAEFSRRSLGSTRRHARKALRDLLSEDLNISPEPELPFQQVDPAGLIEMTVTATRERYKRRSQRADHAREFRDVRGHCRSEGADCAVVVRQHEGGQWLVMLAQKSRQIDRLASLQIGKRQLGLPHLLAPLDNLEVGKQFTSKRCRERARA